MSVLHPDAHAIKPGDVDGDCQVDASDFNILTVVFGVRGINVLGDINGNGRVDLADFALLKKNFGDLGPCDELFALLGEWSSIWGEEIVGTNLTGDHPHQLQWLQGEPWHNVVDFDNNARCAILQQIDNPDIEWDNDLGYVDTCGRTIWEFGNPGRLYYCSLEFGLELPTSGHCDEAIDCASLNPFPSGCPKNARVLPPSRGVLCDPPEPLGRCGFGTWTTLTRTN